VSGGTPLGKEGMPTNHQQQSQLAFRLKGHVQDIQLDLCQYPPVTREEDAKSRAFVMERKIGKATYPKKFVFRVTRHVDREYGRFLICLFLTVTPP
jgi:hypothetical protein